MTDEGQPLTRKQRYMRKYYRDHSDLIKHREHERYAAGKEEFAAEKREWRKANPERAKAIDKKSYDKNRDKKNARSRAYHLKHRDKLNADAREYHATHREENNRKRKENYRANPERERESRIKYGLEHPVDQAERYRLRKERLGDEITRKNKEWYVKHPGYIRNSNLKKYYGLGIDGFNRMLKEQGGNCALCGSTFEGSGRKASAPAVDHDHRNKIVRGVVHQRCNIHLIGGNTVDTALRLVAYLSRYTPRQESPKIPDKSPVHKWNDPDPVKIAYQGLGLKGEKGAHPFDEFWRQYGK